MNLNWKGFIRSMKQQLGTRDIRKGRKRNSARKRGIDEGEGRE
jgi:hypothetical protein